MRTKLFSFRNSWTCVGNCLQFRRVPRIARERQRRTEKKEKGKAANSITSITYRNNKRSGCVRNLHKVKFSFRFTHTISTYKIVCVRRLIILPGRGYIVFIRDRTTLLYLANQNYRRTYGYFSFQISELICALLHKICARAYIIRTYNILYQMLISFRARTLRRFVFLVSTTRRHNEPMAAIPRRHFKN